MNKKRLLIALGMLCLVSSCAGGNDGGYYNANAGETLIAPDENGNNYLEIIENDYTESMDNNKSSFSLDSSSAAYTNIRSAITNRYGIDKNSVIIEQMINYFNYDYASPNNNELAIYNEVAECPWNKEHKLASIAVKSKEIDYESTNNNNYVFLIDVSGSMSSNNKLPYVKKSVEYLINQLNDNDLISIVTYSGKVDTILDGVKAVDKSKIMKAVNQLKAGGCTAGGSGIEIAYKLAEKHFIQGGNNQILLSTDGDFNVGISSIDELCNLVSKKQENGINLSCFGYGTGNYKDTTMQTLALNGNGNVFYIDNELEIEKTFSGDISSILKVVSKDSKIQVTFNTDTCESFRLIGYENRMMSSEEFNDSDKDAGEIYSNRTVVALYEIVPLVDNQSYYSIDLKYKNPETLEEKEIFETGAVETSKPSDNHVFASCVAEFGLLLRDSKYKGNSNYIDLLDTLNSYPSFKNDILKKDFINLVTIMSSRD